VFPVTTAVIVQADVPAAIAPPLKTIAFAVEGVSVPVQPVPANAGVATANPTPRVSVNPIPLCARFPVEFVSVIVSVLVPPTLIEGMLYDLVTVGGGTQNVRGP